MPTFFERLVTWFIPASFRDDVGMRLLRARLLVYASLFFGLLCVGFAIVDATALRLPGLAGVCALAMLGAFSAPFVMRISGSLPLAANVLTVLAVLPCLLVAWLIDGIGSPALSWLASAPVLAVVLGDRRSAVLAASVSVFGMLTLAIAQAAGWHQPAELAPGARNWAAAMSYGTLVVALTYLALLYDVLQTRAREAVTAAHAQLAAAREQAMLADRMASVGTLAAGVAHEINNPLTYVLTNVDYASARVETIEREELGELFREIRDGVIRVRDIVRQLRTLSRVDPERRVPVDVPALIEQTLRMVGNEVRHRAALETDLARVSPVLASDALLGQVLLNLVVNALQALPDEKMNENVVTIRTYAGAADAVVVEVQDNGPGIPPDVRARIFEPFFTTKPLGQGTGLGLAICRNVVTALGGRIELLAPKQGGTLFRVTLPPAPNVDPDETMEIARPGFVARRSRILVVDDEEMVGRAICRALSKNHDVCFETDPSAAVARLSTDSGWDVVLCDVMMPRLPGPDVYALVVERCPELARRFVFLTGGAFTERARRFLDAIPNRTLAKPVDPYQLEVVIAEATPRSARLAG